MPEKIIFRGASLRSVDVRQSQNGEAVFARFHMSAEFTDVVRKQLDWSDLPESYGGAKLKGELNATHMELIPNGKELANFGKPDKRELRFVVRTAHANAEHLAGRYIRKLGKAVGQLKISYSEQQVIPEIAEEKQARLGAPKVQ